MPGAEVSVLHTLERCVGIAVGVTKVETKQVIVKEKMVIVLGMKTMTGEDDEGDDGNNEDEEQKGKRGVWSR